MNYTELTLTVVPDFADILTAELAELGYESFVETDEGLNAYITEPDFDEAAVQQLVARYAPQTAIAYTVSSLEKRNWNAEWERDYEPIEVAGRVRVRASFHQKVDSFQYDIIINPKMSFGTGHHETTAMMIEQQLGLDFAGKTVLDVGCGTGILAILAAKMGAKAVLAFDIEEWAVENARENADLNNCPQLTVFQGTIANINPPDNVLDWTPSLFDVVLANINRNVLLAEIPVYTDLIKPGGYLLVSGFYEQDAVDIERRAVGVGLRPVSGMRTNQWTSLLYHKPVDKGLNGVIATTLFTATNG